MALITSIVLWVTLSTVECSRHSTAHWLRQLQHSGVSGHLRLSQLPLSQSPSSSENESEFDPGVDTEAASKVTVDGAIMEAVEERKNAVWEKRWAASNLTCGANPKITSTTKRDYCPEDCPLHVENRNNDEVCDFSCVKNSIDACKAMDPKADVPDVDMGICRSCMVLGCSECRHDGSDKCQRCAGGYRLNPDGTCYNKFWWAWYAFFGVLGIVGLFVVAWIVEVANRPITNKAGLLHGLHQRSRGKLRQPNIKFEDSHGDPNQARQNKHGRDVWPVDTNLCNEVVAGPGLLLSFRFQVWVIIWGALLGVTWVLLGLFVDDVLFILGTRTYETPRQQCNVVAWGYETQHKFLWTKVLFCAVAYFLTFVGSVIFGISQMRTFQKLDEMMSTHKDFAIQVNGLEGLYGADRLEEELKELFQAETGRKVEAVSVAWAWQDEESHEQLMDLLEQDLLDAAKRKAAETIGEEESISTETENEDNDASQPRDSKDPPKDEAVKKDRQPGALDRIFYHIEATFLSTPVQKALTRGRSHGVPERHQQANRTSQSKSKTGGQVPLSVSRRMNFENLEALDDDAEASPTDLQTLLEGMKTNGRAFVIFETEPIRDEVVDKLEQKPISFRGKQLTVEACFSEPDTVKWHNLTDPEQPENHFLPRFFEACEWVGAGLFVWTIFFYAPFVVVSMNHNFHHGMEPDAIESFTFSMVVCLGNVIMYTVCSEATDRMKFVYVRHHEVCYMLFYTFACMFNVLLDLVVTFLVAHRRLKGLDIRTYHGSTMDEVPTTTALTMTYGMQRELANNMKAYSFPGTFLLPFLIEPIVAVYVPWQLMVRLVRCHKDINLSTAEAYLASIPFDLSRYADIQLNVILATMILMFPGGYNLIIFFGLAVSHCWIYAYDHMRVLRFSPYFHYCDMSTEWWAQWMFCLPAGICLSTLLFKANQMMEYELTKQLFGSTLGDPNVSDVGTAVMVTVAFLGHIILHTFVLLKVVPLFGIKERKPPAEPEKYVNCAMRLPLSFANANPVAVLRSNHLYCHEKPLVFCVPGKEYLLVPNPELGEYFKEEKLASERYGSTFDLKSWKSTAG